MKAYLLAAGLGTRLRPLTDLVPKCLVPVGGEPLLGHWLRLCRRHGIEEVLVNTHHLAERVRAFAEGPGRLYGVRITLFHEPRLLGSAGTVRAASGFAEGEAAFLILYADNLTETDLSSLAARHAEHGDALTIALFRAPGPERCGVAEIDAEGRVVAFTEKPTRPRSPWASAGIFAARPSVFRFLDEAWERRPAGRETLDFGFDVLPRLAAARQVRAHFLDEPLIDVGTPESYAEARRRFARGGAGPAAA